MPLAIHRHLADGERPGEGAVGWGYEPLPADRFGSGQDADHGPEDRR